MKLCLDCAYCVLSNNVNGLDEDDFLCSHPKSGRISMVTGEHIMDLAAYMRNDNEQVLKLGITEDILCGSKAKYFTKKAING